MNRIKEFDDYRIDILKRAKSIAIRTYKKACNYW